jgi:hypothetical protein
LEIYNEEIKVRLDLCSHPSCFSLTRVLLFFFFYSSLLMRQDLLNPSKKVLKLRENRDQGVYVEDLCELVRAIHLWMKIRLCRAIMHCIL